MNTMTQSRRFRFGGSLAVAAVACAAALMAQPTQQVDVNTLGPQVGERAIPFSLVDQNGEVQTATSAAGPKGTMLVFFRSADW